jgi:hypothetical protein
MFFFQKPQLLSFVVCDIFVDFAVGLFVVHGCEKLVPNFDDVLTLFFSALLFFESNKRIVRNFHPSLFIIVIFTGFVVLMLDTLFLYFAQNFISIKFIFISFFLCLVFMFRIYIFRMGY